VEYGGRGDYGNIFIENCTPELVGDSIGHSSAWGVYLDGTEYPDPDMLRANNTFYDCASGAIRVPDGGIAERPTSPASGPSPTATIVRGVLRIGAVGSRQNTGYRADLLDISGRKVMELHPGPNDVSRLSPGVYFVQSADGDERSAVKKVVVTR
jgi:hypothetical protein